MDVDDVCAALCAYADHPENPSAWAELMGYAASWCNDGKFYRVVNPGHRTNVPAGRNESEPLYLIWSNECQAWMCDEGAEFSLVIEEAGRFSKREALSMVLDTNRHTREGRPLNAWAVPEPIHLALLEEEPEG